MSHDRAMRRDPERGSAMLVTLILIAALLAGAAVLVAMQLSSSGAADLNKSATRALHCAEAGLAAARPAVIANADKWGTALGGGQPSWLDATVLDHDLDDNDGATTDDFTITLVDNVDEFSPTPSDPASDNDLRVFIVSTCKKYPDTPKEVRELVQYQTAGKCYNAQKGGCGKNNNQNTQ